MNQLICEPVNTGSVYSIKLNQKTFPDIISWYYITSSVFIVSYLLRTENSHLQLK